MCNMHQVVSGLYYAISVIGCGGTLTTSVGGFTSPNYPLPYHASAECYWHIKTSAGSRVVLSFGDFHLENSINCFYDYLAVREQWIRQFTAQLSFSIQDIKFKSIPDVYVLPGVWWRKHQCCSACQAVWKSDSTSHQFLQREHVCETTYRQHRPHRRISG